MEFQILTDLSSLPQTIDFNFEAMKVELDQKLDYYRSLVVTEDGIKGAKEDRAALNKLKAAIDARRKEIKKQCLAPYEAFEAKCKELTSMIDEASSSIDSQVKAFDEREKKQKRQQLEDAWSFAAGDLTEHIGFSQIFNTKWLNKSVSLSTASLEIEARVNSIRKDIEAILSMHLSNEIPALAKYYETLDLSAALSENLRLQKLALAEEQKKEPVQEPEMLVELRSPCKIVPPEKPQTIKVIFYDTTAAFRSEMRALTDKYGVKYGGIK